MFGNLSEREQLLIKILIGMAVTALIYYGIIIPSLMISRTANPSSEYERKAAELQKIHADYLAAKKENDAIEALLAKNSEGSATMIKQLAEKRGINSAYLNTTQTNIQNKYTRINTDIKINSVSSQNLLEFVNEVEQSEYLIYVNYLNITRGLEGRHDYDALIKFYTYTGK